MVAELLEKFEDFIFHRVDDSQTLWLLIDGSGSPLFFQQSSNEITSILQRFVAVDLEAFGGLVQIAEATVPSELACRVEDCFLEIVRLGKDSACSNFLSLCTRSLINFSGYINVGVAALVFFKRFNAICAEDLWHDAQELQVLLREGYNAIFNLNLIKNVSLMEKILTSSILRSITRNSIISKHSIAISSLSEHITSKHLHQVRQNCLLTLRLVPLPGLVSPCLHQIMIRALG